MNEHYWNDNKLYRNFLINIFIILGIGLIMVYSSSYLYGKETFGSSLHFLSKQLIFSFIGIGLLVLISKSKLSFWIKYSIHINLGWTILLALTFIPGIGLSIKGANRWLYLGGMGFQPGEFVKYTVMLASLYYFENFLNFSLKEKIQFAFALAAPLFLLVLQPDYGSFSICFLVICFVSYISNFSRKYFYSMAFTGAFIGIGFLFTASYRIQRILTFLDPWKNPKTSGFQIIQSYLAFANGSLLGQGLGNSNEKLFYLPEAHNDFIFSVIGEELGFIGVAFIVFLFLSAIYLGFRLALQMKQRGALILSATVIFILGLQSFLNMAVVLGLLPTKGLNLPFISYGGSSLLSNFLGIGLLCSAVRYSNDLENFNERV